MHYRRIHLPARVACAALAQRRRLLRERVSALALLPDKEFAAAFPAVVVAVEAAFRHEEALLELLGDACLHPRRADHAAILCALHRTASRVEAGDVARGRQVAAALAAILCPPTPAPAAAPLRRAARPAARTGH